MLFRGLPRAHGVYNTSKAQALPGEKIEGTARTARKPVTAALWKKHTDGVQGLGIVPITDEGISYFGAIDVDMYGIDIAEVERNCALRRLPLVPTRTKSGGIHLYCFSRQGVPAQLLRARLTEWSVALGYGGSEIFPKQSALLNEDDVGNWINMPYFGANKTNDQGIFCWDRYGILNGEPLTLAEYLDLAERRCTSEEQLQLVVVEEGEDFFQGPPCLQALSCKGFGEGQRNKGLFAIGVYLKKRYPDLWQEKLEAYNKKFMRPPLEGSELKTIINSLARKEYNYACSQDPIKSVCERKLCRTREFGVGQVEQPPVVFGDPHDLWASLPPVQSLPRGILPNVLEDFAFSNPNVFAPAALGACALTVSAMATSGNIHADIEGSYRESFVYWTAIIGPSSAGKTPILNLATAPLEELESREAKKHAEAMKAWEKADKEERGEKPSRVRYTTQDATKEGLMDILEHTVHGCGLVNNELSTLINAMDGGGYKAKDMADRGAWLHLYDTKRGYNVDRRMRGPVHVPYWGASVLGNMTTDKMDRIMREGAADGLMSRMSIFLLAPAVPSEEIGTSKGPAYHAYRTLIQRLVDTRPLGLIPVELAANARKAFGAAKKEWMHAANLYADSLPRYSERINKLVGVALRTALGFAVIEYRGDDAGCLRGAPEVITQEQMERAIEWVRYQTQHDHEYYAAAAGCETIPWMIQAKRVAGWILRSAPPEETPLVPQTFQLGDVTRAISEWRGLKPTDQFQVLTLLEQLDWCRALTTDGEQVFRGASFARGTQWIVNPKVHEIYAERKEYEVRYAKEQKRLLEERVNARRAGQKES
jgi:hypothetical protein